MHDRSATGSRRTSSAPTAPTASTSATCGSSRARSTTSTWSRPTASSCASSSRPTAQNYGVLTFASDHGLYEHIEAFGNGDSGIYPGSGPEGHCKRYGIEIRNVNSHHNVLGYSGTAGNGTFTHNSSFHHNNAGISDDSFASGHPGMPQDCSKWDTNAVYSNNENYFTNDRDAYCKNTPFEKRKQDDRLPAVPGAGRLRLHPLRRQRQPHLEQRHLRQLALGRAAVLGAGGDPRRERPGEAVRHLERQQVHPQPAGLRRRQRRAARTASTSSGTSTASATAGRATSRPAGRSPATRRRCPSARRARCCTRQHDQVRRRGAVRDLGPARQPGPARLHLVHDPGEAAP